ncbi:hypothetical protein PybrP1_008711 [[Pythium] brassicae (nom. inval.)]|nr:hypothetical protein PybrP1_008711 [[Pythium] brassicae (nom. inval.)]
MTPESDVGNNAPTRSPSLPTLPSKRSRNSVSVSTRLGVLLLPRPKRRRHPYFLAREAGEQLREWVRRNLEDAPGCFFLDVFLALLSLFVVVFNVCTFWDGVPHSTTQWMADLDFSINVVFTIEYFVRLYAAFDRWDYVRALLPLAELAVLLPSWMQYGADALGRDAAEVAVVLRSLRVVRLFRFLEFARSSLERQLLAMLLTIVCIVLATAGILQVVEACFPECEAATSTASVSATSATHACQCQNLSYIDLLYFVVVSISTLGYGDIAPVSTPGKFFIAFVILLTFIVVPIRVSSISQIVSSHTDYASAYSEAKQHPHVVVTGHVSVAALAVFFREFFHPSNLNWDERVVVLHPQPPTVEIKKLLNEHESKVQYLVGSPMLDEDLDRAVLGAASACYVLVNRHAARPQHADQCSALITIALRRGNPTCPIYTQVLAAENAGTILKMGASDVVVAGLLQFSVLARSCEMCGLPTLLLNLLANCHSDLLDARAPPLHWQRPYLHGVLHGVFLVDIPRTFSGFSFGDLIKFLYDQSPIVPLALLTEDGVQFPDLDFKLGATADPNLCCKVYAIAKGLAAVEHVAKIDPEQVLSYRKTIRRKAHSMMDVNGAEADKKVSKPALGNESVSIRQSLIASYSSYSFPERYSLDDDSTDYNIFANGAVPSDIAQHIIVCGFPRDTHQFLKTIREAPVVDEELGSPPVVFLAPAVVHEDEFAKFKHFPDVYFVPGSPVNFADLKKTRIDHAVSILILTRTTESPYSDPNMIDADAITTLRYIVEISQKNRMPNLVVELDKPTNVKLLSSLTSESISLALLKAPTFNRKSSRPVRRLSSHRTSISEMPEDAAGLGGHDTKFVLEEYIVSGRVYTDTMIDALMSECYRKAWVTQFVHVLINGVHDDPKKRRLFQLKCPPNLAGTKYSTCFRKFLEATSCAAIGIWRPAHGIDLPHPCVFVNPPPELTVEIGDLFFLVGRPFTFSEAIAFFGSNVNA